MDVDYGRWLQEIFLRYAPLRLVINNRVRRTFVADVNTVITVALAPRREHNESTRFCTLRRPFEELEAEDCMSMLLAEHDVREEKQRIIVKTRDDLFREGVLNGQYKGSKWGGLYHRAPDVFFTILEKGQNILVRLGDIAEVRRGFTTGANDFFYLTPLKQTVKDVAASRQQNPHAPVRVQNGAGWEGEIEAAWLRPVIKSPRELTTLRVRLEDLRYLVFMPPKSGQQALLQSYPLAKAYIRWGEQQGYSNRRTCASRGCWWDLGNHKPAGLVWPMIHNDRLVLGVHDPGIVVDHNLFEIISPHTELLASSLAATYQAMIRELVGRVNLGQGALKTEGIDIVHLIVLDTKILSGQQHLCRTFNLLADQPVRSIFEELGFQRCNVRNCTHPEHPWEHVQPDMLTLDQVREASPDRFELDRIVFDVLGLTDEERLEVYHGVAHLVKERLLLANAAPNH